MPVPNSSLTYIFTPNLNGSNVFPGREHEVRKQWKQTFASPQIPANRDSSNDLATVPYYLLCRPSRLNGSQFVNTYAPTVFLLSLHWLVSTSHAIAPSHSSPSDYLGVDEMYMLNT